MSPASSSPRTPGTRTRVRILILETDEPHPEIAEARGGYASILDEHFQRAAASHDPPLAVETEMHFVVEDKGGEIPAVERFDGFDGVLITGSMYDAHEEEGWVVRLMQRLKEVWQTYPSLHFSGVCFGHQLLSRLLGSTVEPAPSGSWELGHSRVDLTPIGEQLFRTPHSRPFIHLHQMHADHVAAPPTVASSSGLLREGTEVHVWGSSAHTAVQGLYIPQRVFTTQAHVAFDERMVKKEIEMREREGVIEREGKDGEEVREAEETAEADHDGEEVARALLRFFAYEDDGIE